MKQSYTNICESQELLFKKPAKQASNFNSFRMMRQEMHKTIISLLYYTTLPYGCRPGQERLAQENGWCRLTMIRILKRLREGGYIYWIKTHRKANQYFFTDLFKIKLFIKRMQEECMGYLGIEKVALDQHSQGGVTPLTLNAKKTQTTAPRNPMFEAMISLPNIVTRRRLPEIVTTYMENGFLNKGSPGDLTTRLMYFGEVDDGFGFSFREFEEFIENNNIATA